MLLEKVQELIGKPYDTETYNCWHLVMDLVPTAPKVDVVATKIVAMSFFNDKKYYTGFKEVEIPKDGDIVLMGSTPKHLHHAGVYVNGGVIHADKPSVMFRSITYMKRLYREVRFYRASN